MMQIRNANIHDAAAIARLSEQLGYPSSIADAEWRIRQLTASELNAIFVAEDKGKIIGWLQVFKTIRLESGLFAEIAGLVIDEAYRGKGIGKLLVQESEAWCRRQNIHVLKVRSNVKRTEAHQFYLKQGFVNLKRQEVFEKESGQTNHS